MGIIRLAEMKDHASIMNVIAEARSFIAGYGSDQWQDGYPEPELILSDIENKFGYVYEDQDGIHAYAALIAGVEPIYNSLQGKWISDSETYVTLHRLAIGDKCRGKGVGTGMLTCACELAIENNLSSVRADTHRANVPMQNLMKKNGFVYCGDVLYDVTAGDPVRICFEKCI